MSSFNLRRELALKYSFETFDFKSNSPEDLVIYYQDIYNKIDTLITDQETKASEESIKALSSFYL